MAKRAVIIRPCPQCGQDYQYRRASGRTFALCETCRRPDCVICGKKVPVERGWKNTCCDICQTQKLRNTQNTAYARRIAANPELNKQNHAKRAEKLAENPDLLTAQRQKNRERNKQRQQDPRYQAQRRAYQAQRWAEKKAEITEKRREFWDGLPEAEKEIRRIAQRESAAESRRRWRQTMQTEHPEEWQVYQEQMRQYQKERKRRLALADLQKNIEKLKDKS